MDRGFVADSVVGREVQIGRGAEVRESILMEGSQVGAWAKIRRIILGPGASIPAGCEIESGDDEPVRYVSRLDAMAVGRELRPTAIAVA
jgi:glucose-1-phosphate adenylyltransferase